MEPRESTVRINASLDRIIDVIEDFSEYPKWMSSVQAIEIEEIDNKKRPCKVRYNVAAMMKKLSYTLDVEYGEGRIDLSLSEETAELRDIKGYYTFNELDDDIVDVTYGLAMEIKVPVGGFILNRINSMVMNSALSDLKKRCEQ